jgi:hypothetical protein
MEFVKRFIIVVVIVFTFSFCASNNAMKMKFPQEIATVYYQTRKDTNQSKLDSVIFFIEFKEALSQAINLKKLYFGKQEAVVKKVSDKNYVTHFLQSAEMQDLIFDGDGKKEYGNKAPIIVKPKFELNQDEAVLEYVKNNETLFFKFIGIKEKQ